MYNQLSVLFHQDCFHWRGIKAITKAQSCIHLSYNQLWLLFHTQGWSTLPTLHGNWAEIEEWEQSHQRALAQKHPFGSRECLLPVMPHGWAGTGVLCRAGLALPAAPAHRRLRGDCEVTWPAWWSTQKLLALHICNIMDSQGGACYKNTQWNTTGGLLFLKG